MSANNCIVVLKQGGGKYVAYEDSVDNEILRDAETLPDGTYDIVELVNDWYERAKATEYGFQFNLPPDDVVPVIVDAIEKMEDSPGPADRTEPTIQADPFRRVP